MINWRLLYKKTEEVLKSERLLGARMFLRRVCTINGKAFLQSKTNQINISEQEFECKWYDKLKRNKRICFDLSFIGFILLHKARNDTETVLNLRVFHQFITACLLSHSFQFGIPIYYIGECTIVSKLNSSSASAHLIIAWIEKMTCESPILHISTSPPWMAQECNDNKKVLQSRIDRRMLL